MYSAFAKLISCGCIDREFRVDCGNNQVYVLAVTDVEDFG
jgi:hypothetical protein